jgi:hypothetical protein
VDLGAGDAGYRSKDTGVLFGKSRTREDGGASEDDRAGRNSSSGRRYASTRRTTWQQQRGRPFGANQPRSARWPAGGSLIDTGTNKLFVRRNARGTSFKKVADAGRSITRDKRTNAKRKVPSGQGDRGDRA